MFFCCCLFLPRKIIWMEVSEEIECESWGKVLQGKTEWNKSSDFYVKAMRSQAL